MRMSVFPNASLIKSGWRKHHRTVGYFSLTLAAIDDSSYASFIRVYEYLGMLKDTRFREVSGAPYADIDGASISGHGAVLQDPRYAAMRLEACFSS